MNPIDNKYQIKVHHNRAWRGREKEIEMIFEKVEESYDHAARRINEKKLSVMWM